MFRKTLTSLLSGILVAGLALAGTAVAGTITGSAHDFSDGLARDGITVGDAWSSQTGVDGQICIVCHAPHNNQNAAGSLLWNRSMSGATFIPYTSPTLDGGSSVSGDSLLCLSCHDGTIALDSYGGGSTDTTTMGGVDVNLVAGPDMSTDHPIGNDMSAAIASGNNPTLAPLNKQVTVGAGADTATGDLSVLLLSGTGTVECGSCHDPHNTLVWSALPNNHLLKIDNAASTLCLTCHEK